MRSKIITLRDSIKECTPTAQVCSVPSLKRSFPGDEVKQAFADVHSDVGTNTSQVSDDTATSTSFAEAVTVGSANSAPTTILTEVERIHTLIQACVQHGVSCDKAPVGASDHFSKTIKVGSGMARQSICSQCRYCHLVIHIGTLSSILMDEKGRPRNLSVMNSVLGCMQAGVGYEVIHCIFSNVGLEFMDQKTFSETQEFHGGRLWGEWEVCSKEAHDLEAELARADGIYHVYIYIYIYIYMCVCVCIYSILYIYIYIYIWSGWPIFL